MPQGRGQPLWAVGLCGSFLSALQRVGRAREAHVRRRTAEDAKARTARIRLTAALLSGLPSPAAGPWPKQAWKITAAPEATIVAPGPHFWCGSQMSNGTTDGDGPAGHNGTGWNSSAGSRRNSSRTELAGTPSVPPSRSGRRSCHPVDRRDDCMSGASRPLRRSRMIGPETRGPRGRKRAGDSQSFLQLHMR